MSNPQRRYGYFKCPECNRGWESSWAWCYRGTFKPSSGQQCQNSGCSDDYVKPYRVERLKCSVCGSNQGCSCSRDGRNVDPAKPHRSELCERCIKKEPCIYRRY